MGNTWSPFNKKGIKIVTGLGLMAGLAVIFTSPGTSTDTAWRAGRRGDYNRAGQLLRGHVVQPSLAKDAAFAGLVVWGGAKALNKKSISFVQFS